ncbi:hypothetical protein PS49_113 [Aeromonas phage PS49]
MVVKSCFKIFHGDTFPSIKIFKNPSKAAMINPAAGKANNQNNTSIVILMLPYICILGIQLLLHEDALSLYEERYHGHKHEDNDNR